MSSESDTKQEKKKDHRAVATAASVGEEEEEDDDIDNGPSHVFLTKQSNCIKFGSLKP